MWFLPSEPSEERWWMTSLLKRRLHYTVSDWCWNPWHIQKQHKTITHNFTWFYKATLSSFTVNQGDFAYTTIKYDVWLLYSLTTSGGGTVWASGPHTLLTVWAWPTHFWHYFLLFLFCLSPLIIDFFQDWPTHFQNRSASAAYHISFQRIFYVVLRQAYLMLPQGHKYVPWGMLHWNDYCMVNDRWWHCLTL